MYDKKQTYSLFYLFIYLFILSWKTRDFVYGADVIHTEYIF